MNSITNIIKRTSMHLAKSNGATSAPVATLFTSKPRQQKVQAVMTKGAKYINPDMTLQEAAKEMKSIDTGFLPIGKDDKLVGTVTDRDIVVRCIATGADPKKTKVSEAMTPDLVYCFDDQDIAEVKKMMGDKQIRRVPVLNRDKRLVGILSMADLAGETTLNDTMAKISKDTGKASKTEGPKHP
eukprot:TRINITY_DN8642_c0_g1_i1.p1 TRINITY_DN8642_c0_g1~~TRINITY_DN8642_c0_g1_i1.p1  ORF type:complete len:184 (-),score=47.70 TRINITY_DN8642_c0_g1_i1:89-640(-)